MSEIIDLLARTDAVKPTSESVARANEHRSDIVFAPLDAPPLRLGPVWRTEGLTDSVAAFIKTATDLAGD